MGQGIKIQCKNCTYKKTFLLGIGFDFSTLENLIENNSFTNKEAQIISSLFENETIVDTVFRARIFILTAIL